MKRVIAFALTLFLGAHANGQKPSSKHRPKDIADKLFGLIYNLPEFKKADAYYARNTNGKHLILVLVNDKGNEDGHYYWVKVDEDHGDHHHTVYNFMIDNKTFKITYKDSESGKNIPLVAWRKQKNYTGLD